MSDSALVSERNKHTVSFTRKVNLGNYQSAEASVFLQIDTISLASCDGDVTAYLADAIAKVNAAFIAAKGAVLDQLGIEYDFAEDGTLAETIAVKADAVTVVRNGFGGAEFVPQPDNHGNAVSGADPSTMDKATAKKWLMEEFRTNPSAFYDNRERKASGEYKSTSPDLKHKSSGMGLWLK